MQNFGLSQNLSQRLSITPQIIQIQKLVQYSQVELLDQIKQQIADNPFLEEFSNNDVNLDTNFINLEDEKKHHLDYNDFSNKNKNHSDIQFNDAGSVIEKTHKETKLLSDDLLEQLAFLYPKDSQEYKIGEFIIGSLDANGFFPQEKIVELMGYLKVELPDVKEVLNKIQNFYPEGIAAFGLRECLLKQAENLIDGKTSLEYLILNQFFELVDPKKVSQLSKALNEDVEIVKNALKNIAHLEPKPNRNYGGEQNAIIIPDVYVTIYGDKLNLSVNEEFIPKVVYRDDYKKWAKKTSKNKEWSQFIRNKQNEAKLLIHSLVYRKTNLMKVMERIIVHQRDFFFEGLRAIKPYTLVKLAEEIEINQGTLSRIVNSKYVQCDQGIFSLRVFFSSSIEREQGAISSQKIKDEIEQILKSYDGDKKLSDQKICNVLDKKGIKVARRTVNKYRRQMDILSSVYR